MRPVPVLAYHHVNIHKGDMVTVLPEVFERQMQYLNKAGYKTLKTEELLSYIKGDLSLKEKAVLITFDDGWLDNYIYAYPVFKKYGINATIFIPSNWINNSAETGRPINTHIPTHEESSSLISLNKGYKVLLNWDLIDEMKDSGLVEFHSHTENHLKCHHLSGDDLFKELHGSKRDIEERLGRPCYRSSGMGPRGWPTAFSFHALLENFLLDLNRFRLHQSPFWKQLALWSTPVPKMARPVGLISTHPCGLAGYARGDFKLNRSTALSGWQQLGSAQVPENWRKLRLVRIGLTPPGKENEPPISPLSPDSWPFGEQKSHVDPPAPAGGAGRR